MRLFNDSCFLFFVYENSGIGSLSKMMILSFPSGMLCLKKKPYVCEQVKLKLLKD